jgi:beta-galactosidase
MGITNFDRRAFLVGAAAAITQAGAQTSSQTAHVTTASPVRRSYELNRGWRFLPQAADNALEPAFDDSRADRITLPHANVRLPWHSFDDRAYEIVSVYRRHFRAPAAWRGYRVFADFDGAMTASTVAINGHAFQEYKGGYTPFSVELTDHLASWMPTTSWP